MVDFVEIGTQDNTTFVNTPVDAPTFTVDGIRGAMRSPVGVKFCLYEALPNILLDPSLGKPLSGVHRVNIAMNSDAFLAAMVLLNEIADALRNQVVDSSIQLSSSMSERAE